MRARDEELALLFLNARTHHAWQPRPVEDATLRELYTLVRQGPTSANMHPLRIVFVKHDDAKARLMPAIQPMNIEKVQSAPVTAIIAYDTAFYEHIPQLFPARPELRDTIAALPEAALTHIAQQSATLSAGYLIIAARALGLDVGPLAGFDADAVNAAFFPDGGYRTLLLINLGYGDASQLYPRNPRLSFEQACDIA